MNSIYFDFIWLKPYLFINFSLHRLKPVAIQLKPVAIQLKNVAIQLKCGLLEL